MASEGEFPKADGDVLYASEVNTLHDNFYEVYGLDDILNQFNLIEINNGALTYPSSTTFIDWFVDADGKLGTIDTGSSSNVFWYTDSDNATFYAQYVHKDATASGVEWTDGAATSHDHTWSSINDLVTYVRQYGYGESSVSFTVTWTYTDTSSEVITGAQTGSSGDYAWTDCYNPYPEKTVSSVRVESSAGGTFDVRAGTNIYQSDVSTGVVQTNAQSITANPTGYIVFGDYTLYNDATATYDISFDGGSSWETGKSFNTYYADVHAGSSMVIKLNLNSNTVGDVISFDRYGVRLYWQ